MTQRLLSFTARTFLIAGMISMGQFAHAQNGVTDSQIEANVLKALAGAPDLASQAISTKTVYGVVTLSGTVQTEAIRVEAENLAANANGVKKVVDEIQIGSSPAGQPTITTQPDSQPQTNPSATGTGSGMVLQSDGTYAPAPADQAGSPSPGSAPATAAVMNDPDNDQAQYSQQPAPSANGQQQPSSQPQGAPVPYGQTPATPPYNAANGAQQQSTPQNGYPQPQQNYPQSQPGYPAQNRYPTYSSNQNQAASSQPWGGQIAGQPVAIPAGALLRVRINRGLASDKLNAGEIFDGFVANDVVAGGFVAIPRGASVQGKVIDARPSGAVSGRGELSVQLTSVTLGGKIYPLVSDTWSRSGPDKTGQTVANAAGFGVAGALIGAIAGRGAGAAIGAGVGAAAGVGASAASGRGQVIVPPEGMLTFHLAQPAEVATVSELEMQRLAYGVPSGQPPVRQPMYARPYPVYGYPPPPPPYGYPAY